MLPFESPINLDMSPARESDNTRKNSLRCCWGTPTMCVIHQCPNHNPLFRALSLSPIDSMSQLTLKSELKSRSLLEQSNGTGSRHQRRLRRGVVNSMAPELSLSHQFDESYYPITLRHIITKRQCSEFLSQCNAVLSQGHEHVLPPHRMRVILHLQSKRCKGIILIGTVASIFSIVMLCLTGDLLYLILLVFGLFFALHPLVFIQALRTSVLMYQKRVFTQLEQCASQWNQEFFEKRGMEVRFELEPIPMMNDCKRRLIQFRPVMRVYTGEPYELSAEQEAQREADLQLPSYASTLRSRETVPQQQEQQQAQVPPQQPAAYNPPQNQQQVQYPAMAQQPQQYRPMMPSAAMHPHYHHQQPAFYPQAQQQINNGEYKA